MLSLCYDYLDICKSSWQLMADELGSVYMHTCGPVAQGIEIMNGLPGLVGFETAFVDGQHTTTEIISRAKEATSGNLVFGTIGLPHGEPVEDLENLNRPWLESDSEGGGYMMVASGSYEDGKKLFEQLEIG